jgi:hypothetical protein
MSWTRRVARGGGEFKIQAVALCGAPRIATVWRQQLQEAAPNVPSRVKKRTVCRGAYVTDTFVSVQHSENTVFWYNCVIGLYHYVYYYWNINCVSVFCCILYWLRSVTGRAFTLQQSHHQYSLPDDCSMCLCCTHLHDGLWKQVWAQG